MVAAIGSHRVAAWAVIGLVGAGLLGCEPSRDPPRVERPVRADSGGIVVSTSDLGFEVELSQARLAVESFQFTTAGELHTAGLGPHWVAQLVPPAHAHPGHYEGGEVIGELRGRFVVDWFGGDGDELGEATLIVGSYASVNFTFVRAEATDGLETDDPLLGHTALLAGVARKGDAEIAFDFLLDAHDDRQLVGVPFESEISEKNDVELGFRLLPKDELGDDMLFDGVDFAMLDADGDGRVALRPDATEPAQVDTYNEIRRKLETHNHYGFATHVGEPPSQGGSP